MRRWLIAVMLLVATTASAQQQDSIYTNKDAISSRALASLGGAAFGMIGGAYVAYNAFPHNCCGDDPGLANVIYGGALGVWFGAALGASLPSLKSVCDFKTRFVRSFAGSVAGSFFGIAAGWGSERFVFTIPLGAAGGSLATLGRCWKSRR